MNEPIRYITNEQGDRLRLSAKWKKWLAEVEQLEIVDDCVQPEDYHKLILKLVLEKYRRQGLKL